MRVAGMLVCLLVLQLVGHRVSLWRVLIVTLVVSKLIVPLQVFHAGFWLSYGAVAALVCFFSTRHPACSAVSALVQAQIVLSLGLSPLLVLLLGEASLLSMPANFLTVPIVTLVTVLGCDHWLGWWYRCVDACVDSCANRPAVCDRPAWTAGV